MKIWKWLCFILLCVDTVKYIVSHTEDVDSVAVLLGLMTGIAARGCALYGTVTYWVLN